MRELSRLLAMEEAEFDVREAAGMEGDCVAHLRCSVFNQGKDMYRSQRHKMRTSPHYLLAGIYKTTLMVAVVRALTPRARQVCKDIVLADMQELVDQAWISPWEHAHLLEQLEYEWQGKSELVVGSVDCSVHEMLDSSLTLRRWVYVSSMAVRKDVRHRGVGEQLLMLAVAHSRKIFGVKHMFLHVEVGCLPHDKRLRACGRWTYVVSASCFDPGFACVYSCACVDCAESYTFKLSPMLTCPIGRSEMGRRCACIREPGSREATWRILTSMPWTGRSNLPSASAGSRRWSVCARTCTHVRAMLELFATSSLP